MEEIEARGNWMSVAADGTLLDGRHRHLAYQKNLGDSDDRDVSVFWYDIQEEADKFALAVELNSEHGDQLSDDDKKRCVLKFYSQFDFSVKDAARQARVGYNKALDWTKAIREEKERRENETIFDAWLACYTQQEIAEECSLSQPTIVARMEKVLSESFLGTNLIKLSEFKVEMDKKGDPKPDSVGWQRPIYNVWAFAKKTNQVGHPGNSEERIVEHLLYLYTNRYDTVLDPFAGGGATIDVCKRRLRRYWASDRFADCHPPGHVRCHNPIVSHVVNPPQRPRAPGPPQVRRRRVAGMLTPFRCWRRSTAPYVARRCAWLCMLVARCPRWPAGRHVPPVGVPLSTGHEVPARPRRIHRSRCWVVAPGHPAQAPPAPVPASWS